MCPRECRQLIVQWLVRTLFIFLVWPARQTTSASNHRDSKRPSLSDVQCWDTSLPSGHLDDSKVSGRSCRFSNVCFDPTVEDDAGAHGKWLFKIDSLEAATWQRVEHALGSGDVRLGTYASSPAFQIAPFVVNDSLEQLSRRVEWINGDTALFSSVASMWFHTLMDDGFGLWWLTHFHGATRGRTNVLFDTRQRRDVASGMKELAREFLSRSKLLTIDELGASDQRKCFESLLVGATPHNVGGPGVENRTLIRQFGSELVERSAALLAADDARGLASSLSSSPTIDSGTAWRRLAVESRADAKAAAKQKNAPPIRSEMRVERRAMIAPSVRSPSDLLVVLVLRTTNRLILNEASLVAQIRLFLPSNAQLRVVHLEDGLSLAQQFQLANSASVFVAMHGSAFANVVFMRSELSAIVELFPYHFERPTYESLARTMDVSYFRWANENITRTRFHEDIFDVFNVPDDERDAIRNNPACVTSNWACNMFWINQDTVVDSVSVAGVVRDAVVHVFRRRADAGELSGSLWDAHPPAARQKSIGKSGLPSERRQGETLASSLVFGAFRVTRLDLSAKLLLGSASIVVVASIVASCMKRRRTRHKHLRRSSGQLFSTGPTPVTTLAPHLSTHRRRGT